MKPYKKIGILILILLIVIQFVQPVKNKSEGLSEGDISRVHEISGALHETFVKKCYDCHSNNTRYPWYFNVQPIGWWLAAHVHEGKEELNFSEFKNYPADRAAHKLEEIGEVVQEGTMPIKAYTFFHRDSRLTEQEKTAIFDWLKSVAESKN